MLAFPQIHAVKNRANVFTCTKIINLRLSGKLSRNVLQILNLFYVILRTSFVPRKTIFCQTRYYHGKTYFALQTSMHGSKFGCILKIICKLCISQCSVPIPSFTSTKKSYCHLSGTLHEHVSTVKWSGNILFIVNYSRLLLSVRNILSLLILILSKLGHTYTIKLKEVTTLAKLA